MECLRDVGRAGDSRIPETRGKREFLRGLDRITFREHGDHARGGGKREQRNFFEDKGYAPRFRFKPPQRPVIEQEKKKRQRDHDRLGKEGEEEQQDNQQIAREGSRLPCVTRVRTHREHEEQAAQDILPLGNPGDRFHVQRMNGEHRSDERAAPQCACHLPQDKKQHDDGKRMNEDVDEMMPACVQPE